LGLTARLLKCSQNDLKSISSDKNGESARSATNESTINGVGDWRQIKRSGCNHNSKKSVFGIMAKFVRFVLWVLRFISTVIAKNADRENVQGTAARANVVLCFLAHRASEVGRRNARSMQVIAYMAHHAEPARPKPKLMCVVMSEVSSTIPVLGFQPGSSIMRFLELSMD
jgi:hypothetical protein